MTAPVHLVVCDNLQAESEAIAATEAFRDVVFSFVRGRCGRPPLTRDELAPVLGGHANRRSIIVGSCCLANLDSDAPGQGTSSCHRVDRCFHLLVSKALVDAYIARGWYLTTPGWLRGWQGWIEGNGFDQETARSFFQETTSGLLLLDTKVDDSAGENLEAFGAFLDLPTEVVPVGLDGFATRLENLVWRSRAESGTREAADGLQETRRQNADYATALDLLGSLNQMMSEPQVIERVVDLFKMLVAPASLWYLSVAAGEPNVLITFATEDGPGDESAQEARLASLSESYARSESGGGFMIRIAHGEERLGVLAVEGVMFPDYTQHYLNLALGLAPVCALSISNARKYQRLREGEEALRRETEHLTQALADIKQLSGLLPICASCKKIRNDDGYWSEVEEYFAEHAEVHFSHGFCPECVEKLYPGFKE